MIRILLPLLLLTLVGSCKPRENSSKALTAPRAEEGDEIAADKFNIPTTDVAHYTGPFTVAGGYALNPKAIKERYKGLDSRRYGTMLLQQQNPADGSLVNVKSPATGKDIYIRDLQYVVGKGLVGIHPIPVFEKDPPENEATPGPNVPFIDKNATTAEDDKKLPKTKIPVGEVDANGKVTLTGESVTKSTVIDLDNLLINRGAKSDRLNDFWDIFAVTTYTHADEFAGALPTLPPTKIQGSITHMGAYYGRGRTRNSPILEVGGRIWGGEGTEFPINLFEVRFADGGKTPRRIVNVTERQVNTILNGDGTEVNQVKFPYGKYEFDWILVDTLADHLNFYAAWIDPKYPVKMRLSDHLPGAPNTEMTWATAIRTKDEFATYCAEHITLSINVALNLPFNEAAYVEAYQNAVEGDPEYGKKLFKMASAIYTRNSGNKPEVTEFTPLWKRDKLADPMSGKSTKPNFGLAWPMQSTVDMVDNFISQYASWPEIGAPLSAAVLLGFAEQLHERIALSPEEFAQQYALPIVTSMFFHESLTQDIKTKTKWDKYVKGKMAEFQTILSQVPGSQPDVVVGAVTAALTPLMKAAQDTQAQNDKKPLTYPSAFNLFAKDMDQYIKKGRERPLDPVACGKEGQKCVKWNTPPPILHRVALGLHPHNKNVLIDLVGTLFDAKNDLIYLKGKDEKFYHSFDLQTGKNVGTGSL